MPRFAARKLRLLASSALLLALAACATNAKQKQAEGLEKDMEAALLQSAQAAEANYNYPEAVQSYGKLLAKHPGDVDLAVKLGRNLRFSGQAQQEIAMVTQLMEKSGRTVPLLLELGKAQLAADQSNLAVPTLVEAKGLDPLNWDVLSTLGVAYDFQGDYDKSREAYTLALAASPQNPAILNNLALSQASNGDLDGAISTLQQAIDQPSATAQVRQNMALLMAFKGDAEGAERMARKDLPAAMADNNSTYYKMLSGATKTY
jgi:Flp pilus assembly protein TadD